MDNNPAMPNGTAGDGGGGQSSRHEIPRDVKDAFATIGRYIAAKNPKLGNLESAINDVIHQDGDDLNIPGLAALALTVLGVSVANIAANESRNPELAREELKQELHAIDEKYRPRIELQAELHAIDEKYRPRIELQAELHAIDEKYRINQLVQELRKYSSVVEALRDAIAQIDRHYPPGTEEARKLSSEMLRDVCNIYNATSDLREKMRVIAAARATYPPHEALENGVWWHSFPGSGGASLPTLPDDAVHVAEMPQVERHATDISDWAAAVREGLWAAAALRAIDREYEYAEVCLQDASAAADDAARLHGELHTLLGDDHKTVKTVGACCNFARTFVDFCNATQELAALEQPETDVGGDARVAELADQAMRRVVDATFNVGAWCGHLLASGHGTDPSTFVADVSVAAAQQAQGAAL